jgi:hypothetical protein
MGNACRREGHRFAPRLLAVLLGALLGGEAAAQASASRPVDSTACRRECNATAPDRSQNPTHIQACLIRCGAAERYMTRQHQAGTPEATGRGSTSRPQTQPQAQAQANLAAGVPSIWPPRGSTPDPVAQPGRALVAYAGTPPSRGIAISMPVERMAAHRGAETECFRLNNNNTCRLLAETGERCLAVTEAIRANGLVITRDPRTYTVTHYGSGAGPSQAAAEAAAIRDCATRPMPGTQCRVLATRCQN